MFRKKILVLCGSQKDLDKNGEPNALADLLKESVHQWNEEHPTAQLDLILKVCSADRTPFLLTPMINEQKVDGIISVSYTHLTLPTIYSV